MKNLIKKEIEKVVGPPAGEAGKADFDVFVSQGFGDYSSNVAMALKKDPENLKSQISNLKSDIFEKVEVAGPGFLNFWLSEKGIEKGIKEIFKKPKIKHQKIQVEFISANPTGPLTLGNGRGGVYGDVLAEVLKWAGFDVTREYYINDAGSRIEVLMKTIEEGKGDYWEPIASLFSGQGIKSDDVVYIEGREGTKKATRAILEDYIKKTIEKMGIKFNVWFSEQKELRDKGKVDEIVKWFKERKLSYKTEDGALWFRAKKFGDDEDRVLIKKDGNPTYFCVDCAYHYNKFVERKFNKVINIWGADHQGDVARLKGFAEALGFKDKLEIILMQHIRLIKDGRSVRMSKREGTFVLIDDVLKELGGEEKGRDAFRYFMLTRSPNTHMDFDMNLAKEQSKKNPVYYVQYAHARMCSILAKHEARNPKSETNLKFKIKNLKLEERNLVLKLIQFGEIVEDTAKDYQVQRLTTYAYELAKVFTDFYENVRVLEAESEELKKSRLALVFIARKILEKVLGLLGISAPERM